VLRFNYIMAEIICQWSNCTKKNVMAIAVYPNDVSGFENRDATVFISY